MNYNYSRVISVRTIAFLGALGLVVLAGTGCGRSGTTRSPTSALPYPIPAKAQENVKMGGVVQSSEVVALITKALDANADFALLKKYYQDQKYSFTPTQNNYITATDVSSNGQLIGFFYRTLRSDGSSGLLFSLYTLPDNTGALKPAYTYMAEINYRAPQGPTSILTWADGTILHHFQRTRTNINSYDSSTIEW